MDLPPRPSSLSPLSSIDRLLSVIQGRIEVRLSRLGIANSSSLQSSLSSSQGITPDSVKILVLKEQRDLVVGYRQSLSVFSQRLGIELRSQQDDSGTSVDITAYRPLYRPNDLVPFFHSPWGHEFVDFLVGQLWFGQASSCQELFEKSLLQAAAENTYQGTLPTPLLSELKVHLKTSYTLNGSGRPEFGDLYFFLTNLTPRSQFSIALNPLPALSSQW